VKVGKGRFLADDQSIHEDMLHLEAEPCRRSKMRNLVSWPKELRRLYRKFDTWPSNAHLIRLPAIRLLRVSNWASVVLQEAFR
jgi:hypothetical protein